MHHNRPLSVQLLSVPCVAAFSRRAQKLSDCLCFFLFSSRRHRKKTSGGPTQRKYSYKTRGEKKKRIGIKKAMRCISKETGRGVTLHLPQMSEPDGGDVRNKKNTFVASGNRQNVHIYLYFSIDSF